MHLKSQVSIEYMLIIGFATLMVLPLLLIYYTYSSDSKDAVGTGQAMQIARKIVDSSESVYYLGKPSQTTLKLNFPEGIQSTNISGKEIIFKMRTNQGIAEIVQVASVNMSGTIPKSQGIHIITFKAEEGYVKITSN
jgi:hypothetical protein